MANIKNLDDKEREKLFLELNDALSQMQHKYYENEKQETSKKKSKIRRAKDTSNGKTVLVEGFNPKYDTSWLMVYDRKLDTLTSVGYWVKGVLFSLLFQLPFNTKPFISVNNILNAKKKVRAFNPHLIDYKNKKIGKEFANFFVPIMDASFNVASVIKNAEQKEIFLFLKELSVPYIKGTEIYNFLEEFTESRIQKEFRSKGIQEAFRFVNEKQKSVPGLFRQSLPEGLVEAYHYLESFKNFMEFVSWNGFKAMFGSKKEEPLEIKKLPSFREILPFLVQTAYIIKQMPEQPAEGYREFSQHFQTVYEELKSSGKVRNIEINYELIQKALNHLYLLKTSNLIEHMISIILQDDDFLILGKPLYQDTFSAQYLKLTQENIENTLYLIREEEVKSYTQHVMKEFLISSGDLSTKIDPGIYTEENSVYLRTLKGEGFPYSILLPLVLYYFKYIYAQLASPFLANLGFKIDYSHKGIKKGFVDIINSLSWTVTELNYFVRDNLLIRGDKASFLVKFLQSRSQVSVRNLKLISGQVSEINHNIKKSLQSIMRILAHLRDELFIIRDDIVENNTRTVVLTRNIPNIRNVPFSTALYKVTTEFSTLIELSSFYFPVQEYKGDLFTIELSKAYKASVPANPNASL